MEFAVTQSIVQSFCFAAELIMLFYRNVMKRIDGAPLLSQTTRTQQKKILHKSQRRNLVATFVRPALRVLVETSLPTELYQPTQ